MPKFWRDLPQHKRRKYAVAFVVIWVLGTLMTTSGGSGPVVAFGVDAAGVEWATAGEWREDRSYGFACWQTADVRWVQAPGGKSGAMVLPLTPLSSSMRPVPGGLFVTPGPNDRYGMAALQERAAVAALALPGSSASVYHVVWQGMAARVFVPLVFSFVMMTAWVTWRVFTTPTPRSTRMTRCRACDYPLVRRRGGNPGKLCPECGTVYR